MEFNQQNGAVAKNDAAKEVNQVIAETGTTKKVSATTKSHQANGKATAEKPIPGPAKTEQPDSGIENTAETPANEPAANPGMSLETKLKLIGELQRRSVQRTNLINRIGQLEAFEVRLAQQADELDDNPYQGCKLIIKDDHNREFVTTTPGLIRLVAQFIFEACNSKLAEIEATINFPNV